MSMTIRIRDFSHQGVGATSSYSGLYLCAHKFDEDIVNEIAKNTFCKKECCISNTLCFDINFLIDICFL